jgi:hypothetical protein
MVAKYSNLFDEDRDSKVWFSLLKEVDSFIRTKGKRPSHHTKDL